MKSSSTPMIADEPRSVTPEPNHPGNRTPRRSHVSIASSKRPSMNAGVIHPNKSKQGMFRRAVPQMPRILACICFGLNLVLPGTGMFFDFVEQKKEEKTGGDSIKCHPVCQFTLGKFEDNHIKGFFLLSFSLVRSLTLFCYILSYNNEREYVLESRSFMQSARPLLLSTSSNYNLTIFNFSSFIHRFSFRSLLDY